jgi:hypothetical protein
MEKKMKLSNETLTVLKNFSSINQGIQFKTGSKLTTVSAGKISSTEPQTGNKVASASAESDLAKNAKPAAANTNVVAPTTISSTSSNTYAMKPSVRNPDSGMQGHLAKKYA